MASQITYWNLTLKQKTLLGPTLDFNHIYLVIVKVSFCSSTIGEITFIMIEEPINEDYKTIS